MIQKKRQRQTHDFEYVKRSCGYSYFNLRCRIKASSLQDKTEGENGILMNNYQQN